MRQLDYPDLTDTPLDLDLRDAKYSIVVLTAIGCKYPNVTQFLKLQALQKINRKC